VPVRRRFAIPVAIPVAKVVLLTPATALAVKFPMRMGINVAGLA
jgi:hypothetical protein